MRSPGNMVSILTDVRPTREAMASGRPFALLPPKNLQSTRCRSARQGVGVDAGLLFPAHLQRDPNE